MPAELRSLRCSQSSVGHLLGFLAARHSHLRSRLRWRTLLCLLGGLGGRRSAGLAERHLVKLVLETLGVALPR